MALFFGQPKSPMQAGRARPSRGRATAWRDLLVFLLPLERSFQIVYLLFTTPY